MSSKLKHIIRHEFKLTAANKTFVVLTILGPFLIFAVAILPTLIAQSPEAIASNKPIAMYGASAFVAHAIETAFSEMDVEVEYIPTIEEGKDGVLNAKFLALLVIEEGWPDTGKAIWYSKSNTEIALYSTAANVLEKAARAQWINESEIDPKMVEKLLEEPPFELIKLSKSGEQRSSGDQAFIETLMTVLLFIMLLYMTILLYGQMIGRSVVTEKTSKTVEIMLSSVTSQDLMVGKILGLGLAGMLQYFTWILMAVLLEYAFAPLLGLTLPSAISLKNLGFLFLFFILGFFLYASAYAALGAASEDEQHLGQLAWPLIMCLVIPLVLLNTLVTAVDSLLVVILSFIPLTSPIVMFARIIVSPPPFWQIALCVALLIGAVVITARFAARIFRTGILMTGKRFTLKEVLHWSKLA